MKKSLLFIFLVGICCSFWAAEVAQSQDVINEGTFAVLVCDHLNAPRPANGWTEEASVELLTSVGIVPISGQWTPGAPLNEGNMAHVLRTFGISLFSVRPDSPVTYAKAYVIFYRYDEFFKNFNLKTKTLEGATTTHIDAGIAGTSAPAPEPATNTTP